MCMSVHLHDIAPKNDATGLVSRYGLLCAFDTQLKHVHLSRTQEVLGVLQHSDYTGDSHCLQNLRHWH